MLDKAETVQEYLSHIIHEQAISLESTQQRLAMQCVKRNPYVTNIRANGFYYTKLRFSLNMD
jgi:hypothetical protein